MSSREVVLACLRDLREQIETTVQAMPEDAWDSGVYESGWNARQLLYHIASTSGAASFILMMSKLPKQDGPAFDNDAFNRDEVVLREGRAPTDVLDEIRANIQRDIQAVEAAPDEQLQQQWVAPWGSVGSVAEIIVHAVEDHSGEHLNDLRSAAP